MVVYLLFNVRPIVSGSYVFVFVLLCITLCPFKFCNHLEEEEKAGCFAIIVLQMNKANVQQVYAVACALIEDSDLSAHPRRLIRVFDGRPKGKSWVQCFFWRTP